MVSKYLKQSSNKLFSSHNNYFRVVSDTFLLIAINYAKNLTIEVVSGHFHQPSQHVEVLKASEYLTKDCDTHDYCLLATFLLFASSELYLKVIT